LKTAAVFARKKKNALHAGGERVGGANQKLKSLYIFLFFV
jgi:hypothetical protein